MLLFIRYSNVSPADLITTLLLNPEVKNFLLFSPPSQFYQMQSEVANRSVQCNKFGAQSYKLWYKWHILTSYLSLIIMIDILLVNIAHTGRSDNKQDMTQWRNVWNASPQEKGGWRVKKKFWSQCTQVIILSYKSYRIPKRYCYISSNIV